MPGDGMEGPADLDMLWEVVREGHRASIEALLIGVRTAAHAHTINTHPCQSCAFSHGRSPLPCAG